MIERALLVSFNYILKKENKILNSEHTKKKKRYGICENISFPLFLNFPHFEMRFCNNNINRLNWIDGVTLHIVSSLEFL